MRCIISWRELALVLTIAGTALGTAAGAGELVPADLPPQVAASGAQIVLLGEIHDNPDHHRVQAAAVTALQPKALVFEMLDPAQVAASEGIALTDAEALSRAFDWPASGWPDFAMYAPIFAAAPEAALYAGGVPRADVRRAVGEGAAAVFGGGAARYGLDRPLTAEAQMQREEEQFAAHCEAMPREMMAGMVEAQRLRDAALAQAALNALEDTGGPVAVIAGSGHTARDAAPAMILLAAPGTGVLSVGQTEAEDGDDRFDLWSRAAPPARDDPCAGFAN